MFKDALCYPWRNDGWIVLLMGAIMMGISSVFCSTILNTLIGGYLAAFYIDIIGSTMTGDDKLPGWPELGNWWDDILIPLVRFNFPALLAFGPAFLLRQLGIPEGEWHDAAVIGAFLLGCLYFPMATMAIMAFGNITAGLPHRVLPGIFRSLPGYLPAALMLCAAVAVLAASERLFAGIPWAGWLLAGTVAFYALIVQARLIGLIYLNKREALGWE